MHIGESRPPPKAHGPPAPRPEPYPRDDDEPSDFARILRGIGQEIDRGERLVRHAVRGGAELGPTELLALQAGVYRYSEAVDLSAKLVDRATNGVKTVIQGQ
jgi:hypothetical protein